MSSDRYSIEIKKSAAREIRAIGDRREKARVLRRIAALAEDPRPPGCQKLSGSDAFRVRQGRFRILYLVDDAIVTVVVVKVGDRRDVYR